MKTPVLFITLLFSFCFLSCSFEKTSTKADTDEIKSSPENSLAAVVNAYLTLKDALVKTDGPAAKASAGKLLIALKAQKGNDLASLLAATETIASSEETEAQRAAFETVSEELYTLLKNEKYTEASLYRQYCPMAFDNKGAYWISDSKEVLNPYFGDKMLKCGMVKEEI